MVGADIALRVFVALLSRVRSSLRGPKLATGSFAVVVSLRARKLGQFCLGVAFWNVFASLCISRGVTIISFASFRKTQVRCRLVARSFFRQIAWLAHFGSFWYSTIVNEHVNDIT